MYKLLTISALAAGILMTFSYAVLLAVRVAWLRAHPQSRLLCSNCGSRDVRQSFPAGALDWFFRKFACLPYRCRCCANRFYRALA